MGSSILRCEICQSYGLSEQCSCGGVRRFCKPPKYSPDDKYAKYRRMAKEQIAEEKTVQDTTVKE